MFEIYCKECNIVIEAGKKYHKHMDGTILCHKCFKKLVKKGVISK